jgi:hypothetical protein
MSSPEEVPLQEGVPDTGDLTDPTAPDPTGAEITDPDDPSFVPPAPGATPIESAPDLNAPPRVG